MGVNQKLLWSALTSGSLDEVKTMHERGIDLHTKSVDGVTPLMWAITTQNADLVTLLSDFGADWNMKSAMNIERDPSSSSYRENDVIVEVVPWAAALVLAYDKEIFSRAVHAHPVLTNDDWQEGVLGFTRTPTSLNGIKVLSLAQWFEDSMLTGEISENKIEFWHDTTFIESFFASDAAHGKDWVARIPVKKTGMAFLTHFPQVFGNQDNDRALDLFAAAFLRPYCRPISAEKIASVCTPERMKKFWSSRPDNRYAKHFKQAVGRNLEHPALWSEGLKHKGLVKSHWWMNLSLPALALPPPCQNAGHDDPSYRALDALAEGFRGPWLTARLEGELGKATSGTLVKSRVLWEWAVARALITSDHLLLKLNELIDSPSPFSDMPQFGELRSARQAATEWRTKVETTLLIENVTAALLEVKTTPFAAL